MFMKRTRSGHFKALVALAITTVFAATLATAPVTPVFAAAAPISITANYTLASDMVFGGTGFIIEANDVTLNLNGYTITGGDGTNSNGVQVFGRVGVTIKNGKIQHFGNGIFLSGSNSNTVKNIVSNDNSREGILVYVNSDRNQLIGNTSNGNSLSGINLWDGSDNNTVKNNTCNNNKINGILLCSCDDSSIIGNTTNGNTFNGLSLWDRNGSTPMGGADNNLVKDNSSSANLDNGLLVGGSDGNTIVGNTASGNFGQGIVLTNGSKENTVKNNTISLSGKVGMSLSGKNNSVIGNMISDSARQGIVVSDSNNSVRGNTVVGAAYQGIAVWYPNSGNTIEGNTISAVKDVTVGTSTSFGTGIGIWGNDNQVVSNTVADAHNGIGLFPGDYTSGADAAHNNTVRDNMVSAVHGTGIGIWGYNNRISGNKVTGAENGVGLYSWEFTTTTGVVTGVAHDNVVQDNRVSAGARGVGILGYGNQVLNNRITDSTDYGVALSPSPVTANTATRNVIRGNDISGSGRGIGIWGKENQVLNNKITNSSQEGVQLIPGSSGNLVQDNQVSKSGILIVSPPPVRAGIGIGGNNNRVMGNKITDTTGPGIGISGSGNEITDNKVGYSTANGIVLAPIATGNLIKDNKVSDSGISGIAAMQPLAGGTGATGNTIIENKVSTSAEFDLFDWSAPSPLENAWTDNKYKTSNF
jgi:parallel beta-helix repeat protein